MFGRESSIALTYSSADSCQRAMSVRHLDDFLETLLYLDVEHEPVSMSHVASPDCRKGLLAFHCAHEGAVDGSQCCLRRSDSFLNSVISTMTRAPAAQTPSSAGRSGVVRNTVLKNGT